MMEQNSAGVRFLYGTWLGRALLKFIQCSGLASLAAAFLRSPLSRPVINGYIRRNHIPMEDYEPENYATFRDFFIRKKRELSFDPDPTHLISPCDGWLSAYPIQENSSFEIKGSLYRLCDLLRDPMLGQKFHGGTCLIFRLCASDYHHYCYIDHGTLERTYFIEGELHSVQPLACETYPVYTLNRRAWSLLQTEHFGPVIQTEVGALIVGGIVNEDREGPFQRGQEKGHFELSGSTIVLLFQRDQVSLLPQIAEQLADDREARVTYGMWIGTQRSAVRSDQHTVQGLVNS